MSNLSGGLVLRGILAILFGIAAVFWPGLTLVTLLYLFATFVLLGGLVELVIGVGRINQAGVSVLTRALTVLLGAVELGVGVYLLRHPGVSFATLILLIGFMLIVRGVFEVVEGLFEEGPSLYRLVMIIVGLLAAAAGILVLFQPVASGVAFVWILGAYSLVVGSLLFASAVEVRKLALAEAPRARR
ncbi:MAG: DUF308 domain-containing protein [Candidatus Saccharibacteria bacterium]